MRLVRKSGHLLTDAIDDGATKPKELKIERIEIPSLKAGKEGQEQSPA